MEEKKKRFVWLALLLLVILGIGGLFLYKNYTSNYEVENIETEGETWTGKKKKESSKETESIAIPGFESINLTADTLEQEVNLYNPEQNDCYFVISLLLPDGTKIWQSKYIEPGKGVYNISLDKKVAEGEYEKAVLKYECFTMDDTPSSLNGSEIKLKLSVR